MARLLQLSDLHVVARGRLASGVLDTAVLLRAGIDHLLDRRDAIGSIDAVLVTGDVSDDGSEESYAFARAELDRLGLPLLVIPGNHDRREALRAAFADTATGMPDGGPIDWSIEVAGTLVIGLDTLVEGRGGGTLRPESLSHLERALGSAQGRPVVVALHHPPLKTGIRFMDAIGLDNVAELAEVLRPFDGSAHVLSGHVHGVHHAMLGRHPVVTAPSMCSAFRLDRRDDAPIGFMTGPRGCAVLDTGANGTWVAVMFDEGDGPFAF